MSDGVCFSETVSYYLIMAKQGRFEDAFHGLIEQDSQIIPYIEQAYMEESHTDIRVMLIQALTQFRNESSIGFLEAALSEANSEIWKASLDGLVSIGGAEVLSTLMRSLALDASLERTEWIKEAVEQVRDAL